MLTLERTTTAFPFLGPALVVHAVDGRIKLDVLGEERWAVTALGFLYQPRVGDTVLAIGQEGTYYVIGVLKGTGPTTITVPADFEVRAPRGRIVLTAAEAVEVQGYQVRISTKRLEILAQTAVERFGDVTRWVRETFQLRAGRLRSRITGTYDVGAERIVERAKGDVKIDGRKIHLG